MSDEVRTDHEHVYPKKSDQCAICGRYRHVDYIKAVVDNWPTLTQHQRDVIAEMFAVVDIFGDKSANQ